MGGLLGLVVAANLSNVLNPEQGLAGAIGTPGDLRGAASPELTQALNSWMQSGSSEVPGLIAAKVHERLAWQQPKAIICTLLLVAFVALSWYLWRAAIRRSRVGGDRRLLALTGSVTVLASFLLVLMVMGNTQAVFAPVTMTILFG